MSMTWMRVLRLHEVSRGPVSLHLEASEADRILIAKRLGLESLSHFRADIDAKPWLDGVELAGHFNAMVEQVCGVTLETFEQSIAGDLAVRIVPTGSPNAPVPETGDVEFDAGAPDVPDVMDGDDVDVTEYLVEHLSLELDPFPRKPGATFSYKSGVDELSPFAALRKLGEPKA